MISLHPKYHRGSHTIKSSPDPQLHSLLGPSHDRRPQFSTTLSASGHLATWASMNWRDVSGIPQSSSDSLTIWRVQELQAASRQKEGGRSCERPHPAQGSLPNTSHLRKWHPPSSSNSPITGMDADTAHLAYSFCTRPGMDMTPTWATI